MFSVPFFTFNPLLISSPDYRWLTRTYPQSHDGHISRPVPCQDALRRIRASSKDGNMIKCCLLDPSLLFSPSTLGSISDSDRHHHHEYHRSLTAARAERWLTYPSSTTLTLPFSIPPRACPRCPPFNINDLRLRKFPPFCRPRVGRGLPLPSHTALLFLFRFDGKAGSFVCVARLGDAIYTTRLSKPGCMMVPVPHIAPRTHLPFTHNDVYACMRCAHHSGSSGTSAPHSGRTRAPCWSPSRSCVACMAPFLSRVMLYVPRDHRMAAMLWLEGCVLV